jgi:hypothetical protein
MSCRRIESAMRQEGARWGLRSATSVIGFMTSILRLAPYRNDPSITACPASRKKAPGKRQHQAVLPPTDH